MTQTVCTSCLRDLEAGECRNTTCLASPAYIPPTVEEMWAQTPTKPKLNAYRIPRSYRR